MNLHEASIPAVFDILAATLPPDERAEFKNWYGKVSKKDFWKCLTPYFSDDEVKAAIAEYVVGQIGCLEHFCGTEIAAIIDIAGRKYHYRDINAAYGC